MIVDDETNFSHKLLLLLNRQVANLRKAFADKSSADIKLSKTQVSKMIHSGGFLDRLDRLSNNNTILIISNNEMKKTVKIVESLENSSFSPEGTSKTIQNEAKEQRGGFLSMLSGTLGTNY